MPEAGGAAGGAVVLWAQLSCVMGDEVQVWRVGVSGRVGLERRYLCPVTKGMGSSGPLLWDGGTWWSVGFGRGRRGLLKEGPHRPFSAVPCWVQ